MLKNVYFYFLKRIGSLPGRLKEYEERNCEGESEDRIKGDKV